MVLRIGDRDPATGLYYVIWPDGSSTLNGVKIFNAAHQAGDVVRVTRRSDGLLMLDGAKAVEVATADKSISVKELGKPPEGYLNGQIWNTEEKSKPQVIIIKFAPVYRDPILFAFGEFYATNQFRTEISIPVGANTNWRLLQPADFKALETTSYIDGLTGTGSTNPTPSNPGYRTYIPRSSGLDANNNFLYQLIYRQIDFKFAREVGAREGRRYLICTGGIWDTAFGGLDTEKRGTVSVGLSDRPLLVNLNAGGYVLPFDLAEYDRPYDLSVKKQIGYVDYQWLFQYQSPVVSTTFLSLFAYWIQIDTQNPANTTFLRPVYGGAAGTLYNSRNQMINA
jgi:hypothetical protein